ncbi:centrosomal protein [Lasius niger]|uniref:Centrosomal protein n=1 Tax=Lasius niger TaxID=67767 RepID=A0A0J7NZV0_LASNI|nr:centrosomal protein [Lasius niger]
MFTPIRGYGTLNDSILNTPQPQASSTIRRKSPLESRFNDKHSKDEQNVSHEKELAQNEEDSSLGLLRDASVLTNISTAENEQKLNYPTDAEFENYARKFLQRCSDTKNSSLTIDTNKENNANVQNITGNLPVSNFTLHTNEPCILESDQGCNINCLTSEVSMTNVTFDPNEITARSSDVDGSAKKQSFLSESFNGINFSTEDIMAQVNNEMMAQLNKEEFLSGSKIAEQLSIDEARWQQDRTYLMPIMNTEKQKLDLTSFSGIMGQLDLSTESCAGQRLSIGQYFERKSANIGMLGNDKQVRPNFGLTSETPMKRRNLEPLVNSTIVTDATATLLTESKEERTFVSNAKDMDESSIISLSTILSTLQNVNSDTPRRLVDQILMAQKKKKNNTVMQNNTVQETDILPSDRKSMLATPTGNSNKFDEDVLENLSTKLSLDSRTKNEIKSETIKNETVTVKQERSRVLSFASNKDMNVTESLTNIRKEKMLKEEASDKNATSSFNQDAGNVVIGKNTERLCNCIIGMTSEVNIELLNHGNMWITYSLKLNEVLGDTQSIELDIPQDERLIKPNGVQSTKDGPKMFSIDFDKSIKLNESHDELTHLILKPHEKFIANIKCEKLQSTSIDFPQKQPQYWRGKLIIHVQCSDGTILFQKEVPLYAQKGTCKIQIVETEIPIIVPRQQSKLLNIVNSGNVATHVSAAIVPIEGYPNAAQNFSIEPADIFLQVGERSSFSIVYKPQVSDTNSLDNKRCAKVKLVAGNNVYLYIVNAEQKLLESEKENYLRCHTPSNAVSLSPATSPQSVTSSRSGSCDRNSPISTVSSVAVAENTIPIKSTHAALVWNSVKTGKNDIKEFTIRNTSNNKIKIQIDIWDEKKSFKFLGDRQTANTSMILVMQRQELKTLAVIFSPYHTGPVIGKITIKHYIRDGSDSQQFKRIPLYGYGGYSKIKILNIFKALSGKMGLSFGTLYPGTTVLTTDITLQNTGDLHSFAKIKVIPKVISPTMDSNWHVKPKELILNPKETRQVRIEFYPKKEDFTILQRSEVSHVATINITWGDEPTRLRIRRLCNKIKESDSKIKESDNKIKESDNKNENEAFKNIMYPICKAFPGEQVIAGLLSIRDSVQNLNDLCTGVHQHEIMLTMEACADDTLPIHYDADETQMFHSLNDITHVDEAGGASFFASQTMAEYETQCPRLPEEQFTVTPSTVVLKPPLENKATVTILSLFKAAEPFQTSLSDSNYFSVVPAEGMLPSKRSFPLKIQCSQRIERNMQALLEIYTENNKQEVLIKVVKQ